MSTDTHSLLHRINAGMTLSEVESLIGELRFREDLGDGKVCRSKVYDELSATGPKGASVYFQDGVAYASTTSLIGCGAPG